MRIILVCVSYIDVVVVIVGLGGGCLEVLVRRVLVPPHLHAGNVLLLRGGRRVHLDEPVLGAPDLGHELLLAVLGAAAPVDDDPNHHGHEGGTAHHHDEDKAAAAVGDLDPTNGVRALAMREVVRLSVGNLGLEPDCGGVVVDCRGVHLNLQGLGGVHLHHGGPRGRVLGFGGGGLRGRNLLRILSVLFLALSLNLSLNQGIPI